MTVFGLLFRLLLGLVRVTLSIFTALLAIPIGAIALSGLDKRSHRSEWIGD